MALNPDWRTSTVTALAARIRETRDLSILPIIADALQDADCYEPWLESLRAGLPVAEAAGYLVPEGWWEYAELTAKIDALPPCGHAPGAVYCTQCPEDSPHIQLRRRRSELRRLHTGACPTCDDKKTDFVQRHKVGRTGVAYSKVGQCPACVLAVRERWDRAKCPECGGKGSERYCDAAGDMDDRPCRVCGGSGDLLLRMHEYENDHFARLHPQPRPLSLDGRLPLVSALVEEIAEEVASPPELWNRGHGTGRVWRPSPWMLALPIWYEVDLEGVESNSWSREDGGTDWVFTCRTSNQISVPSDLPRWLFNSLPSGERNASNWVIYYPSTADARQSLIAAIRQFRYGSAT